MPVIQQVDATAAGSHAGRYRVVRTDDCTDLPGTIVMADVMTGEVIMREDGWDRLLDDAGQPRKDYQGNEVWEERIRKYQFPPGSIKIMRR